MEILNIKDDFIKLGQALKLMNLVENGGYAKNVIQDGKVSVNNEICTMRGKKLYNDDIVSFENYKFKIKSKNNDN